MSRSQSIEFVLRGKSEGTEISPKMIGITLFNQFNTEVETLIGGTEKLGLDECRVDVQEGSYKLLLSLSPVTFANLAPDLELLKRQDTLGELDPRRAEVISKWQARARAASELSYEIRPRARDLAQVKITKQSDFQVGNAAPWIMVEKYLYGQIVDMGGANKANVHLRLLDGGKIIKIDTTQKYLEKQSANRLYHKTLLHVRAEQHHKTGTWKNVQLISFVDYQPKYDESALDRFAESGTKAWEDVPDDSEWIQELRGGK
jgi:hypothetical protein